MPKTGRARGSTAWRGSGRWRVRRMRSSMSRSTYMLIAFAPPAASVPPTMTAATSHSDGSAACGEDHGRDRRHQQQLDDARLRQRDVGAGGVDRSGLRRSRRRGRAARTAAAGGSVSSSQTDAPHSAAPTARCGTTKSADSLDDDVRPPERDLERHQRDQRRSPGGAGVGRRSSDGRRSPVQTTSPATTTLMRRCASVDRLLAADRRDRPSRPSAGSR